MDCVSIKELIKWILELGADYIVPTAAIAVTYVFGRLESRASFKHQQLQDRYEKFYVPYISKIYQNHLWDFSFQDTPIEEIEDYFVLVFENVQYLGPKTRSLLPEFYELFWRYHDRDGTMKGFAIDKKVADRIFRKFSLDTISEALELSTALRLPPLGQELLKSFGSGQ